MGIGTTLTYGRYRIGLRMDKVICQMDCSGSLCLMLQQLWWCFTTPEILLLLRQPPSPIGSAHPVWIVFLWRGFSVFHARLTLPMLAPAGLRWTLDVPYHHHLERLPTVQELFLSGEEGDDHRGCCQFVLCIYIYFFFFFVGFQQTALSCIATHMRIPPLMWHGTFVIKCTIAVASTSKGKYGLCCTAFLCYFPQPHSSHELGSDGEI